MVADIFHILFFFSDLLKHTETNTYLNCARTWEKVLEDQVCAFVVMLPSVPDPLVLFYILFLIALRCFCFSIVPFPLLLLLLHSMYYLDIVFQLLHHQPEGIIPILCPSNIDANRMTRDKMRC